MSSNNIRILLVEDNPGDARLVRELLKGRVSPSFDLVHAARLAESITRLEGGSFDIVLLDLNLPDSSGMEGVESLAAAYPNLPIIVLTSLDDEETGLQALHLGADDYLTKGKIDDRVLTRVILYAIERRRFREELRRSSMELETANASLRASRSAALNLLEDAEQARRIAEERADALRRSTHRAEILAHAAERLLVSPEPGEVVDSLCRKVMEHLDCHVFFNYLADPGSGRLHLNACGGITTEQRAALERLDFGAAVCGCVARDGVRIVAEEIPETPDPRTDPVRPLGVLAYACHPLPGPEGVIGTLSFGTRTRPRLSEDDLSLMKAVADLAAIAFVRRRAVEAQQLSEARFRIALKNSPITVAALDRDLRYTWVYNTRHGFAPGQVVGRRPDELIPPEDAREITAFLERALSSGAPQRGTISGRTRGEEWVYDITSEPLSGGDGGGTGLMIALIDITERTQMERDLLELETYKLRERSQKEWQATVDHITDMISIHDRTGAVLKANKAFRDFFGLASADLEGKHCFTLFNRRGIPPGLCPMKTAFVSGAPEFTEITEGPGGRILEASAFPFASADGRPEGCIHVLKDVTARKESEMQLIMNERLAALGQMAAGIAHEINNPLATISGCAEGLMNRTRKGQMDPALFADYLGIIDEEIVRCKAITSSMLSFVRRGDPQRQTLNAREVMDRTLELIGFQGRLRNVDLLKNYASWVEPIHAAETELKQVFAALLANALDSMRDTGRLVVAMDDAEGTIRITVQDSGPGIPAGIADRIFDPFFTTKQGEGGTGLGLPIARRIVESMGGTLEVASPPGEGATFTVTLPRA